MIRPLAGSSGFLRRPTGRLYAAASALTSGAAAVGNDRAHAATKYAVAPLLMLDLAAQPGAFSPARRTTMATLLTALTGSALGDHFMLAESRSTGTTARAHLRRGASAFAVQQLGLMTVHARVGYRFRREASLAAGVTLAALAVVDGLAARRDGAGSTPDPVVAGYGVLLASMAALTQGAPAGTGPFAAIRIGGPLFLVSDAVIVARQLLPEGRGRAVADGIVMSTYTAALGLLVDGTARLR